jgi:hypothetical protein
MTTETSTATISSAALPNDAFNSAPTPCPQIRGQRLGRLTDAASEGNDGEQRADEQGNRVLPRPEPDSNGRGHEDQQPVERRPQRERFRTPPIHRAIAQQQCGTCIRRADPTWPPAC